MTFRGIAVYTGLLFAVGLLAPLGRAQQVTGLPPFGSFSGGPVDTVNNANFNVHFAFPIINRAGRGMPFSYTLTYDTGIWLPVMSGSSTVWSPAGNWGWGVVTQAPLGYVSFVIQPTSCTGPPPNNTHVTWTDWNTFEYVDWLGTAHRADTLGVSNWVSGSACGGGPPTSAAATLSDGSGYTLSAAVGGSNPSGIKTSVTARSGTALAAPQLGAGSGSITDTNGNGISATLGSTTVFTDTLGATALSVSGAGNASSPQVLSYTNPAGGTSSYTINYKNQTVRTNFGCSGISEYNSPQALVSSITLPDGTAYTFNYESTPGYSGDVTGRLQSITLPTGGAITYTYTDINCGDGSPAWLTRATTDGTWTYAQSGQTRVITDPLGNQTQLQFQGIYETQRKVYQSSTGERY